MELEIEQLADGCVRVSLDQRVSCIVSSMHLVEDKRPQLERALQQLKEQE